MPHDHIKCNSWMLQRQTNTKVVATYFILSAVRACLLNNLRSEAKGFKIAYKRVLPFKKGNLELEQEGVVFALPQRLNNHASAVCHADYGFGPRQALGVADSDVRIRRAGLMYRIRQR